MTDTTDNAPAPAEGDDTAAAEAAAVALNQPAADASAAPEPEPEPEGDPPPAKPKQTAQERIDDLTKARREAERRADELEARLAKLEPKPEPAPKAEDGEPDPEEFEAGVYDPAYVRELTKWTAREAVKADREATKQAEAASAADATFNTRLAAAAEKHADFNEKVLEGSKTGAWDCSPTMFEAIKDSELGPDVAYHLASNPDDARRIAALSPLAQVRELGRIEAGLTQPAKPTPKLATDAPEPAPQARGGGGKFGVAPDTNDFAAFDKQYQIT